MKSISGVHPLNAFLFLPVLSISSGYATTGF